MKFKIANKINDFKHVSYGMAVDLSYNSFLHGQGICALIKWLIICLCCEQLGCAVVILNGKIHFVCRSRKKLMEASPNPSNA
jgi:hypothetical protein